MVVPVPDQPSGIGNQRCCWQRTPKGLYLPLVEEVVEFEPQELIAFVGRQHSTLNPRLEIALEGNGTRTRVEVRYSASRYRHEWGQRGQASERYVERIIKALELAMGGAVPTPANVDRLLLSPDDVTHWETQEIEISALPAVVWGLVNEQGSRIANPYLEREWVIGLDGHEVFVDLFHPGGDVDRLQCGLSTRTVSGERRIFERGIGMSVEMQVLTRERASALRVRVGWNAKSFVGDSVPQGVRRLLERYNAAAEDI